MDFVEFREKILNDPIPDSESLLPAIRAAARMETLNILEEFYATFIQCDSDEAQ